MERIRQAQHSASRSVHYAGDDETDKIVVGRLQASPKVRRTLRSNWRNGGGSALFEPRIPVVDRGCLSVHSLLMLKAAGDCCADQGMLQAAQGVMGDIGSDTTFRPMIADLRRPRIDQRHRRCDAAGPHPGVG